MSVFLLATYCCLQRILSSQWSPASRCRKEQGRMVLPAQQGCWAVWAIACFLTTNLTHRCLKGGSFYAAACLGIAHSLKGKARL